MVVCLLHMGNFLGPFRILIYFLEHFELIQNLVSKIFVTRFYYEWCFIFSLHDAALVSKGQLFYNNSEFCPALPLVGDQVNLVLIRHHQVMQTWCLACLKLRRFCTRNFKYTFLFIVLLGKSCIPYICVVIGNSLSILEQVILFHHSNFQSKADRESCWQCEI